MIRKFRKKPVVIEALQWGGSAEEARRIVNWVRNGDPNHPENNSDDLTMRSQHDEDRQQLAGFDSTGLWLKTLESGGGRNYVDPKDWVIRGIKGEFYACKPDIFAATYEPAEN